MTQRLLVLAVLLLLAGVAQAAPGSAQGDGGTSAFYTWTADVPAIPGRMLRTEPLEPQHGLPMAGAQFRILYSATDGTNGHTPIAVSGAYFVPKGQPPTGGWPLIAWAHGTTGLADVCAPSWRGRSERDIRYLQAWLQQGFAIVATDYQGLGTPGPHPYMAARPAAYSVLDSIRAVTRAFPDVGRSVVLIGQSQGAHAVFAAAGIAPDYAPELPIRGTVATGIPFLGRSMLRPPIVPEPPGRADPLVAYRFYLGLVAQRLNPSLQAGQLFTPLALPVFEEARTTCVEPLFRDTEAAGLNRQNALGAGFAGALATIIPAMEYTTFHVPTPILLVTGSEDRDAPAMGQRALASVACTQGTVVEAHIDSGLDHNRTVMASLTHSIPFVRKIMAGTPIKPVCDPTPE